MNERALITGGAGFIGSHLADRLLELGWRVVALDDLSTGSYRNIRHLQDQPRFRFVQGSVLDPKVVGNLVAGSDVVYHMAAAVGVQLIVDRPLQSMLTNIRGTEVVLEAAQRHRTRILIASTSEIYGKSPNGPFKEDDDRVLGPTGKLRWSYSISKAVDEILAYVYHRELSLPAVVARLFNTVGPRQTGRYGMVVPRFVAQALHNEPVTVYGDGRQSRVFTYVRDVVEALIKLTASTGAEGQAFNVAGHEEIRIKDLAQKVIDKTRSRSSIILVPYAEAYGDDYEDTERRAADTTRLEATTGYRCTTSLDETLEHMIDFTRKTGWV
jgi:UDP-glucose 4-epimerase